MPESSPGFLAPATYRWRLLRRSGRLAGTALLAAILVACGGSDGDGGSSNAGGGGGQTPVDLLASFKQQTLSWKTCDASYFDEDYSDADQIAELGERAQCALMRVPLDYDNPSSGELQIEVLKVAAEQTSQKLGAIVLNPGGPGGESLSIAPEVGLKLADADPDEAGALLQEMSRRYDLVAFSARGTGRHSPLHCELSEEQLPNESFIVDSSPENVKKIQHNARLLAEACAANPMSKHVHTDATARDMDLLRGLLGEEKLNYIGYSYGTWLGTWYAGLFPERVGRMLLDGSVDAAASFDDALLAQIPAQQRIIDELMLPHAISNPARFGLGNDVTALRNRLIALPARLKLALRQYIEPAHPDDFNRSIFAAAAALGLQDVMARNPSVGLSTIQAEIAASAAFAIPQVAAQAFPLFLKLTFPEDGRKLSQVDFVYWSVGCNNSGKVGTEQHWVDVAKDYAERYPLAGDQVVYNPCLYWSGSEKRMPAMAEVSKAGPLLMLHSQYDAATSIVGARKMFEALPNARMVVVEDEYLHQVFPYGTACVDRQVANYFLHGQLPERLSSCAGKELGGSDDDEDA